MIKVNIGITNRNTRCLLRFRQQKEKQLKTRNPNRKIKETV